MQCPYCGNDVAPGISRCPSCGGGVPNNPAPAAAPGYRQTPAAIPPGTIPNHMAFAILATVFTAMSCIGIPLGITAIVFASQVNGKLAAGDMDGAQRSASLALVFCWVTAILGGVLTIAAIAGGALE